MKRGGEAGFRPPGSALAKQRCTYLTPQPAQAVSRRGASAETDIGRLLRCMEACNMRLLMTVGEACFPPVWNRDTRASVPSLMRRGA